MEHLYLYVYRDSRGSGSITRRRPRVVESHAELDSGGQGVPFPEDRAHLSCRLSIDALIAETIGLRRATQSGQLAPALLLEVH